MTTENRKKAIIAKRCTIDLTVSAALEVERLQKVFELSVADVFRYSLFLLGIYADAISSGKEISAVDPKNPDKKEIIKLPIFTNSLRNNKSFAESSRID